MTNFAERIYFRLRPKAKARAARRARAAQMGLLRRRGGSQGVTLASATAEDLRLASTYNERRIEQRARQRPRNSRIKRNFADQRRSAWLQEVANTLKPGEIVWDLPRRERNRILDQAIDIAGAEV